MKYTPTIGLEIHAELKTATKMFCNSKNDPDESRPNVNVCPVCMGNPGTLPVVNKEAVKSVLKVGLALGGELADFTEFDRKNYFYPDIPKGYQISQYKYPLVSGGELNSVKITVIHLAKEAADFARELQLLLRYLGVAEANMEKGEMRVEANISVSKSDILGTKVEVKNLNSFKVVEKAIEYEIKRQTKILEEGEKIAQETRGWDEQKGETFSQRQKEESHDYRYFPEPDIPKMKLSEFPEFSIEALKKELPELPKAKRERYTKDFEIKKNDIEIFIQNKKLAEFFEVVAKILGEKKLIQLAANYIINDVVNGTISSATFVELIVMIGRGELSSRGAKDVLAMMLKGDDSQPIEIAQKLGLFQKNDEAELEKIVKKTIDDNPKVVSEYKAGKIASLEYLVGQGMKMSKSSANPITLRQLLMKHL